MHTPDPTPAAQGGETYPFPAGFVRVSREEFFGSVGQLNVHPRVVCAWDDHWGYLSAWELQDLTRRVVGYSVGGVSGRPRYPEQYARRAEDRHA